jgi:hypothetical protein
MSSESVSATTLALPSASDTAATPLTESAAVPKVVCLQHGGRARRRALRAGSRLDRAGVRKLAAMLKRAYDQ